MQHSGKPNATLKTARLELREFVTDDLERLHSLLSSAEVMRFSAAGALSYEQTKSRLAEFIASYPRRGFGKWAATLNASGEFIGYCGVELTSVENNPVKELGFRFLPEFWGKGYASESGRAVIEHCFTQLKWSELFAFAAPDNTRSIHTLEKLGFRFQKPTRWQHLHLNLYRVTPRPSGT